MPPLVNIVSCGIIEKDCNGDVLWTWCYPAVTDAQKSYVTKKWNFACTIQKSVQYFVAARQDNVWIYIHSSEALAANKLPRVKRCALVLLAKDLNDYQELCRILSNVYWESGDPTQVLKHYLLAFTEGTIQDAKGCIISLKPRMNDGHAKRLIKTFELETILIYTALLLKKRIVVYHHSLEELFDWIKTFPTLMKHRKVTDNLFPWVDIEQLGQLKTSSINYVAGCQDSCISSKPEFFDLLVNIPAREITVAQHAKESLTMTKAHKEIALFMVQLCQNEDDSRNRIIDEIADKTQELLNQLKSFAGAESPDGEKILSAKAIRARDLPPAVENFLINLGVVENLFSS